jgi:hypothetical protein
MPKHMELWSILAIESFVPAYPTSIRGNNDQRGIPGTR